MSWLRFLDEIEVSGSDVSQSSEMGHGFFVKLTCVGCNVDGLGVGYRLLGGSEVTQVVW